MQEMAAQVEKKMSKSPKVQPPKTVFVFVFTFWGKYDALSVFLIPSCSRFANRQAMVATGCGRAERQNFPLDFLMQQQPKPRHRCNITLIYFECGLEKVSEWQRHCHNLQATLKCDIKVLRVYNT